MNKLQYQFCIIIVILKSRSPRELIEFIRAKNVEFSTLISFYFFVASVLERQPESRPIKNLYSLQSNGAQSQVDATQSAFFSSFLLFLSLAYTRVPVETQMNLRILVAPSLGTYV